MEDEKSLWGGIKLPEWNLDRFFVLFGRVRSPDVTRFEQDEFSRLLMRLVTVHVRSRSWRRSLAQHHIDPEDAASKVLQQLVKKIPRLNLVHNLPKVLIDNLNQAISNDLISVLRDANRKSKVKPEINSDLLERSDHTSASPGLNGLVSAMAAAESLMPKASWARAAYRRICHNVLRGNQIEPVEKMPRQIRDRISADEWFLLVFRTNGVIDRYAADLA